MNDSKKLKLLGNLGVGGGNEEMCSRQTEFALLNLQHNTRML